jgi:glycosyltransferase involved in cell wall biosynthesis
MISILIPIYNGIEFIDESVSSVINQTYENWELIIGVNGHPENSDVYKIAKKYDNGIKIRVIDLYNIKGKSNALNEMIKYCSYDYVALLDVDDIWFNNKLQLQSNYLNNYDVVGSQCIYFGDISGSPTIPIGDITNFDFISVNPVINSSTIIKKELCYWNENGIEDYDLWLRLWKKGCKFYNCEDMLILHRIHNASSFNVGGKNHMLLDDLLKNYR